MPRERRFVEGPHARAIVLAQPKARAPCTRAREKLAGATRLHRPRVFGGRKFRCFVDRDIPWRVSSARVDDDEGACVGRFHVLDGPSRRLGEGRHRGGPLDG